MAKSPGEAVPRRRLWLALGGRRDAHPVGRNLLGRTRLAARDLPRGFERTVRLPRRAPTTDRESTLCFPTVSYLRYSRAPAPLLAQGVVFTLIIIRVGLGYTLNDSSAGPKVSDGTYTGPSAIQTIGGTELALRPMAINVSVSRTDDRQSLETYDRKDARAMTDVESGTSHP